MRKTALIVTTAMLLGCASPLRVGSVKLDNDYVQKVVEKGKTTKREVIDRLGAPDSMMKGTDVPSASASDIWVYRSISTAGNGVSLNLLLIGVHSSSSTSEKTVLTVFFDDHDVVKDYSLRILRD